MEKEAFAVIQAVKHFKFLLFASKVIIHTDNNLLFCNNNKSTRITRWKYILPEYELDMSCISGSYNSESGALSRISNIFK